MSTKAHGWRYVRGLGFTGWFWEANEDVCVVYFPSERRWRAGHSGMGWLWTPKGSERLFRSKDAAMKAAMRKFANKPSGMDS